MGIPGQGMATVTAMGMDLGRQAAAKVRRNLLLFLAETLSKLILFIRVFSSGNGNGNGEFPEPVV